MGKKVTEDNVIELYADYVLKQHTQILGETSDKCPYESKNEDVDQSMTCIWALYNVIVPSTGLHATEEFARRYIDDPKLAAKLCRATKLIIDAFEVMRFEGEKIVIRSTTKNKTYRIIPGGPIVRSVLKIGSIRVGMIHPWEEDGTYMMDGVFDSDGIDSFDRDDEEDRDYEKFMQRIESEHDSHTQRIPWLDAGEVQQQLHREWQTDAESIKITPRSKLRAALKKYPAHWTKTMCVDIGMSSVAPKHRDRTSDIHKILTTDLITGILSKMSDKQTECIRHVVESGGFVKFHTLEKTFGSDDTDYTWRDDAQSIIGSLRRTGILLVGKMTIGSKDYKVAVIAADVLGNLRQQGFGDDVDDSVRQPSQPGKTSRPKSRPSQKHRSGNSSEQDDNSSKRRSRWSISKWLDGRRVKIK